MRNHKTMDLPAILLVALLAVGGCDSGSNEAQNNDFEAFEPFSSDVQIGQRTRLRLNGINGLVEIEGSASAERVMITGNRRVQSESLSDAERHLDDVDVDVVEERNEVFVETVQPHETRGRNYIVDYMITLPDDFDVSIENINGNITVQDVDNASVRLINGNVDLVNVRSEVFADLTNGVIDSFHESPPDDVDLTTVNGGITLEIPTTTSATFRATVVNGNVSVSNLQLQDRVETPTEIRGVLGDGDGRIELSTTNGGISASGH